MSSRTRLSGADRRHAILTAAAPLFARSGREGAKTSDIAKVAGISEALLYKHFSSKEALYQALEQECMEAAAVGRRFLDETDISTASLVIGVAVLVEAVFIGIGPQAAHEDMKRFLTGSLLGDGRFAKAFLARHVEPWISHLQRCLNAAREAGDVEDGCRTGVVEMWFVHHLANTLHLIGLPDEDVVDYGMTREEQAESAVRFLLRGFGLKTSAIDRFYDPTMFRLTHNRPNDGALSVSPSRSRHM